ncbi:MAG: hypothetical protein V1784_03300 [bacterium]
MSRRGIFLLVFVLFVALFSAGWALTSQALAIDTAQAVETGPQISQSGISAIDPVPPPPPPKR